LSFEGRRDDVPESGVYPGHDPAQYDYWLQYINQRWGQLYQLEKEWAERALSYLLVTNAGGAIATLSFLGASERALNLGGVKLALVAFVLGIALVGVLIAKTYHHMSGMFKAWRRDTESFRQARMTWMDLQDNDSRRAQDSNWDYVLGYAAFCCFLFGSVIGGFSLFV
jgi:hypothetical protein